MCVSITLVRSLEKKKLKQKGLLSAPLLGSVLLVDYQDAFWETVEAGHVPALEGRLLGLEEA